MNKRKVLFFDQTARMGGAEKVLLDYFEHYDPSTIEAVLVSPVGPLSEAVEKLGIQHVEVAEFQSLQTTRSMMSLGDLKKVYQLFNKIDSVIQAHNPDILVSNSVKAHIALNYKKREVPTLIRLHDYYSSFSGISRKLLARALRHATRISCVSNSVADDLLEHDVVNRDQVSYCHNGIEAYDTPLSSRNSSHYKPRIIVAGWLLAWKGFDVFVDAMESIAEQAPEWEFVIAGDVAGDSVGSKEYAEALRARVQASPYADRFIFHGKYKSLQELVCCEKHCIFVQPSLRPDPLPTVLLEASALKLPIIASSLGGSKEIIEHSKSGHLIQPTVEELTKSVLEFVRDAPLRLSMGNCAYDNVRAKFSLQAYVRSFSEAIVGTGFTAHKKIAIVHDFLNQMGGAERVVAVMHKMFPDAPIYTLIADRYILLNELQDANINVTWMQNLPGINKRFKLFFWLYPLAIRSFDLSHYDIVLSSSSSYAKGVKIKNKQTKHICYCHTPMRFAWDFNTYIREMSMAKALKLLTRLFVYPLRWWDRATHKGVNLFIANSTVVKQRIKNYYNRDAVVIYPPVDINRFEVAEGEPEDYYLVVSRFVSYKRIDLAIQACESLGKKLLVIGDGQDRERLRSISGKHTTFLGRLPDAEVTRYMQQCKAFIFPGIEDFGITPLEVNACGRPVIAFRGGGALNTIQEGKNGLFFDRQDAQFLSEAIERFEAMKWDPHEIRRHAEMFSEERFIESMLNLVQPQADKQVAATRN